MIIDLFVYGTLKEGFGNNRILSRGARKLGPAQTEGNFILMDFGGFPGMYEKTGQTPVTGELWEVDGDALQRCDYLEGHPTFYKRTPITVVFEGSPRKCETYFYQGHLHGRVCEQGIWPRPLSKQDKPQTAST